MRRCDEISFGLHRCSIFSNLWHVFTFNFLSLSLSLSLSYSLTHTLSLFLSPLSWLKSCYSGTDVSTSKDKQNKILLFSLYNSLVFCPFMVFTLSIHFSVFICLYVFLFSFSYSPCVHFSLPTFHVPSFSFICSLSPFSLSAPFSSFSPTFSLPFHLSLLSPSFVPT